MNSETFNAVLNRRLTLTKKILNKKKAEYAPDNNDRMHNFSQAAKLLNCTTEQAIIGMAVKHIVSIIDIATSNTLPTIETIEEKIGDTINYLVLLEARLKEKHTEQSHLIFSAGKPETTRNEIDKGTRIPFCKEKARQKRGGAGKTL